MFNRDPLEKLLKKAEQYLKNNQYPEAKETYLKCLAFEPDNLNAMNNLAQIYKMLGDDLKSGSYNEMLLKECNKRLRHEQDETVLMVKANALTSLERNSELNETLDALLKVNPNNILGLFQKAHFLEINGENLKAIEYIDRILKETPYNIPALLSKGRNYFKLDEFEEAENCYNLVFKIETKNSAAINLKSELLKKKLNIKTTPHDFMQKALDCWKIENFDSSAEFFEKAIEMNPNYDEIWFAQGELFIRMGRINDAINSFKQAFKLNPNSGGIVKHNSFFRMLNQMKFINKILGFE